MNIQEGKYIELLKRLQVLFYTGSTSHEKWDKIRMDVDGLLKDYNKVFNSEQNDKRSIASKAP